MHKEIMVCFQTSMSLLLVVRDWRKMLRRALVTDVKPDLNPHLVDDYGSAGISPRHRTRSRPGSCTKDEKLVEGNC